VRREARILSESNYRAGRAVVINQIPRRDDATKTNRPQGNPLVKHACLACIIFEGPARTRKSARACLHAHTHTHVAHMQTHDSHSRYPRTREALAPTWRARSFDLAPYSTNCARLSLSPSLPLLVRENRDGSTGQSRSSLGASRRASSCRLSPITPTSGAIGFPRARDGSAERIKCNSEEADPEETGLTDPELAIRAVPYWIMVL